MSDPRNYPYLMMYADEAQAGGWHYLPPLPPSPEMAEVILRRANEDAAAVLASNRRYLMTGKGRIESERVDAASRAQIERTKEHA